MDLLPGSVSLLSEDMASSLAVCLPPTVALRVWKLIFDTSYHGISLLSFFALVEGRAPAVILLREANGTVFGGFSPEGFRESRHYYGTGETFVFTFQWPEQQDRKHIMPVCKAYPWSGENNFFVYSDINRIMFGGGYIHDTRSHHHKLSVSLLQRWLRLCIGSRPSAGLHVRMFNFSQPQVMQRQ